MHGIGLLGLVITGMAAGVIAQRVVGHGRNLMTALGLGLLGAVLGAFIAEALGLRLGGWLGAMVVATPGAVLILATVSILRRDR